MSHVSDSEGPRYPISVTQVTPGVVWTNHANAAGPPDGVVAGVSLLDGAIGRWLRGLPPGLGFSIPAGATITGIEVVVRCRAASGSA